MPRKKKLKKLESPLLAYPSHFSQEIISKADAIELISIVVYPFLHYPDAEKRIREKLRIAKNNGDIPDASEFSAPDFFDWASRQRAWKALAGLAGLPRFKRFSDIVDEQVRGTTEEFSIVIPADVDVLRKEFRKVSLECQRLEALNKELLTQNQRYLEELEELRPKFQRKSDVARENASKPRRRLR